MRQAREATPVPVAGQVGASHVPVSSGTHSNRCGHSHSGDYEALAVDDGSADILETWHGAMA
jgi:hypothetical protein